MISAVIFDMGNVLLAYQPLLACYRHARDWDKAKMLCDIIFRAREWPLYVDGGLMTDLEYAEDVKKRLDSPELQELAARVLADWWHDGIYLITGMDKVVEELLDAGIKLYILSNVGYSFPSLCYKIPCIERFSGVMLSCEEKLRKPDPELFRRLCARYNLRSEECLFVDDMAANVESAMSLGMHGHVFDAGDIGSLRSHLQELLKN